MERRMNTWGSETLEPIELKFSTIDYLWHATSHAKIGGRPMIRIIRIYGTTMVKITSEWPITLYLKSTFCFIWSTPKSRPNNMGQMSVRPYVRPSTKSFSDSDEIWYVSRGRWVMHDGMPYDPIQGQGQSQGHETFKVRNSSIFKIYLLGHF